VSTKRLGPPLRRQTTRGHHPVADPTGSRAAAHRRFLDLGSGAIQLGRGLLWPSTDGAWLRPANRIAAVLAAWPLRVRDRPRWRCRAGAVARARLRGGAATPRYAHSVADSVELAKKRRRNCFVRSSFGLLRTCSGGPCSTIVPSWRKTTRSAASRAKCIS
jgi:hypothetical protein